MTKLTPYQELIGDNHKEERINFRWDEVEEDFLRKFEFNSLQERIVSQTIQYKGTKLDAFYRFSIGEIGFNECVDAVAKEFESSK